MNFTGERVIPGAVAADLFNEHWARYLFAQQFAAGRNVLDAACGSGYGSGLLARAARRVIGVDLALDAVEYARDRYGSGKAMFARADCLRLPFASGQFDLVAAFEIIEHLDDAEAFLRELQRVLSPSGLLLISTPNRLYYTEDRGAVNPFHTREFSYPEFAELMGRTFPHRSVLLQDHVAGILLSDSNDHSANRICCDPQAASPDGSNGPMDAERRQREAYYMVAVASAQPLPAIRPLLYLPSTGNVLRERETHIHRLEEHLGETRKERDAVLSQLHELESDLEQRTKWARALDQTLAEKNAYLLQLQSDYAEQVQAAREALTKLQQEFEERTAWALRLDAELRAWHDQVGNSLWYRIGKNLRLSPVPSSDQRQKRD